MTSDWCTSPAHRQGRALRVSCNDNTYLVLDIDPGAYTPPADQRTTIGS